LSWILTSDFRTEPTEDSKLVLLKTLDIPRRKKKPVTPEPDVAGVTNGTAGPGKRKREGEDELLTNGHVAKKVAGESAKDGDEDVVVINDDEGAILIDD
jgi:ubiquitin-like 1-activating enzyme E1 B